MDARRALRLAALLASSLFAEQVAWGVFDRAAVSPASSLKVLRGVPEGNQVPALGRQIVVTFDRPVAALSDTSVPTTPSPVRVSPQMPCQWHWLDPRSVACELATGALAPATRYTVTVASGLRAEDGTVLESEYRWSFATERPAITQFSCAAS
jgi:alpha-2-macroglobulin